MPVVDEMDDEVVMQEMAIVSKKRRKGILCMIF